MTYKIIFTILVFSIFLNISKAENLNSINDIKVSAYKSEDLKPHNFKLETHGHNWAIISWELPDLINRQHTHYLYRNGKLIARLNVQQTIYKDVMLKPNSIYTYEIHTNITENKTSKKPKLSVKTFKNTPPNLNIENNQFFVNHEIPVGSHIHTFKAEDKNQDKLYYNLSGADSNSFMVNKFTGEFINRATLEEGRTYTLQIQVSDGMIKQDVAINISTTNL